MNIKNLFSLVLLTTLHLYSFSQNQPQLIQNTGMSNGGVADRLFNLNTHVFYGPVSQLMVYDQNNHSIDTVRFSSHYDALMDKMVMDENRILLNIRKEYDETTNLYPYELWVSDATKEGTYKLEDLEDDVYFFKLNNEGYCITTHQIVKINTFTLQLELVADFKNLEIISPVDGYNNPDRLKALVFQNQFYFFLRDADNTSILWKTDGTAEGTLMVSSAIPLGVLYAGPNFILIKNFDGIWRTDGTENGSYKIRDFPNASGNYVPSDIIFYKERFYFIAYHPDHGNEIWTTDGTEKGTQLFFDYIPGPESSRPGTFTVTTNFLLFLIYEYNPEKNIYPKRFLTDGTKESIAPINSVPAMPWRELAILPEDKIYFNGSPVNTLYFYDLNSKETIKIKSFKYEEIDPWHTACPMEFISTINDRIYFDAPLSEYECGFWEYTPEQINTANTFKATKKNFTIYPNPITNAIRIKSEKQIKIQSIKLYNSMGILIYEIYTTKEGIEFTFDISPLQLIQGIYYLNLNNENESLKIIKEE